MERENKKSIERASVEERLEQIGEQPKTIMELLPRYYEAYGDNPMYEVVRSMPIDGHDVAYLEYTGHVEYDITGRGQEGKEYSGRELKCQCDFTQGVGWDEDERGPHGIMGSNEHCVYKEVAQHLRVLELRREFQEKYKDGDWVSREVYGLWEHIPEIMMDMIDKDKAGEFTSEGSSGAHFWGGHYYLQTIHEITKIPYDKLWENVNSMVRDKKIQINGMVVQEWYEPPEPRWDQYSTIEAEGYKIVASLPAHEKMKQVWSYDVLDSDDNVIIERFHGSALMHSPDFGVDVEDIARAEENADAIIKFLKETYEKSETLTPQLLDEFAQIMRGDYKFDDELDEEPDEDYDEDEML